MTVEDDTEQIKLHEHAWMVFTGSILLTCYYLCQGGYDFVSISLPVR